MSTSSEHDSPPALVELELRSDLPGAELLLVDGAMKLRARGFGSLLKEVEPGVYTARVRIGEASREELVVLRPGQPRTIFVESPLVESAIPIDKSMSSREYHQAAVQAAVQSSNASALARTEADLLFFVREWTHDRKGRRERGPLLGDVRLCDGNGNELYRIWGDEADGSSGDRFWSSSWRLPAGFYRLRIAQAGVTLELPLYAVAGWQKHVYLLVRPSHSGVAIDLSFTVMVWQRPGTPFDPYSPDLRQLEWARLVLQSQRKIESDANLTAVLFRKFENPMLALLGAHALVQRKAIAPDLLKTVVHNLRGLLGPLPDVVALELALERPGALDPVSTPPLLKRSWAMLLDGSITRPGIVARNSPAERLGLGAIAEGVWMCWRHDESTRDVGGYPSSARTLMRAARVAWSEENHRRSSAGLDAADSNQALQRVVSWFGIPRGMLDDRATRPRSQRESSLEQLGLEESARSTMGSNNGQRMGNRNNEEIVRRMFARRPQLREKYAALLDAPAGATPPPGVLAMLPPGVAGVDTVIDMRALVFETIVRDQRPVFFTKKGQLDTSEVASWGEEAQDLVSQLTVATGKVLPALPLVGRIDVTNFPTSDFVGTGWFVERDVVITNRHVAQVIARWDGRKFVFVRGAGATIGASLCNAHEDDDPAPRPEQVFRVAEVLYIEPESGPNDIAFFRVERPIVSEELPYIEIAEADAAADLSVCVVGYPARASRESIPDQAQMERLYRNRFNVKRVAPGYTMGVEQGSCRHDCTTLGGSSGSVLLDLASGRAVGLHFAGLYRQANYAVPASVLREYVRRRRWNRPPDIGTGTPAAVAMPPVATVAPARASGVEPAAVAASLGSLTFTIPMNITVSLGAPVAGGVPGANVGVAPASGVAAAARMAPEPPPSLSQAKEAVRAFWRQRPAGVLGVRIGFLDEAGEIGDTPCIAASVAGSQLSELQASAPSEFQRVLVRYLAADVSEQLASQPLVEAVDSIAYDDKDRTGAAFSFTTVEEEMKVTLHVGPEYSWAVLSEFLSGAQKELVSAMYEFHAPHIKDVIEQRQRDQVKSQMVVDTRTFSGAKPPEGFDRPEVFQKWEDEFGFERLIAPLGRAGLISDAYHMKVTVRDGVSFWLSSGNWKGGSSQPIITQEQRDNVGSEDLTGNREWHVVVENKTLAQRFRSHIRQDFERSATLGARELPKPRNETLVDVPLESADLELETRKPPVRVLEPLTRNRTFRVKPLLTPDRRGAVYSKAVLNLIRGAKESLLFQIPYIGLPSDPSTSRGFIDDLIDELASKMAELEDGRIIVRGGLFAGKRFSSPMHLAWHLKASGVDVKQRLRTLEDTHTKGMVIDGKRVLIGSHNWSGSGVSLNRDASLIFDDREVADYYAEAFEIDWARAVEVKPRQFVVREAIEGVAPPPGYMRMPLSEALALYD